MLDLVGHLVDATGRAGGSAHWRPISPGLAPGFGVAGGGDPDRQFLRDRARLGHARAKGAPSLRREIHRLAAPQPAQPGRSRRTSPARLSGGVFSGRSTKSSGCQPEAMASPARPLVRLSITAHSSAMRAGWCSGSDAGPGAHADVLRDRRHRGAGDRGVRIGAAEGMEVAFRRPDRAEAVAVGELRAFQQQLVLLRPGAVVVAPVVEAEIHLARADAIRRPTDTSARSSSAQHDA